MEKNSFVLSIVIIFLAPYPMYVWSLAIARSHVLPIAGSDGQIPYVATGQSLIPYVATGLGLIPCVANRHSLLFFLQPPNEQV